LAGMGIFFAAVILVAVSLMQFTGSGAVSVPAADICERKILEYK